MRSNQGQGTYRSGQQSLRPPLRTERAASALSCSDRIVSRAQCILAGCRLSPALGSHGPTSTPSSRSPYATEARRLLTRCVPSLTSSHAPLLPPLPPRFRYQVLHASVCLPAHPPRAWHPPCTPPLPLSLCTGHSTLHSPAFVVCLVS